MKSLPSIVAVALASCLCACEETASTRIETLFCQTPTGACSQKLVTLAQGASKSLECAVYSFTLDDVADALVEAVERGVEVWVVYEQTQANPGVLSTLEAGGVYLRGDGNPDAMHHKFMVVDGRIVASGSFNWSFNADNNNDENLMVFHSPELAELYRGEFKRVWELAE